MAYASLAWGLTCSLSSTNEFSGGTVNAMWRNIFCKMRIYLVSYLEIPKNTLKFIILPKSENITHKKNVRDCKRQISSPVSVIPAYISYCRGQQLRVNSLHFSGPIFACSDFFHLALLTKLKPASTPSTWLADWLIRPSVKHLKTPLVLTLSINTRNIAF